MYIYNSNNMSWPFKGRAEMQGTLLLKQKNPEKDAR